MPTQHPLWYNQSIPTIPVSYNHAYPTRRNGGRFLSAEGRALKEHIMLLARTTFHREPSYKSLFVFLFYTFADRRRRDVDNYHKIILDALTGIVYKDDSQIVNLLLKKTIGDTPSIGVYIYEC